MTDLDRQLREDRSLRDAAKALIKADYEHLRLDLQHKGFGDRIIDRLSEGAVDVFDDAVEAADKNRGIVAALMTALVLWFARNPIMSLFFGKEDDEWDAHLDETEQHRR